MDLVEREVAGLLPAPPETGTPGAPAPTVGLWWPARDVAFQRLGALPPAGLLAVERRWGAAADAELARAVREGSLSRLTRLAATRPVTNAGAKALLLLADLDLEAGRSFAAARRLDAWLRLRPSEAVASRVAVFARCVDALALAGDERGVVLLARRAADLGGVVVPGSAPRGTLSSRISAALNALTARRARSEGDEPSGPPPPAEPEVLWSRSVADPGLVRAAGEDAPAGAPVAQVAVADGALYVAEPRVVRRLDLDTGRTRWTFPPDALHREHAPEVRYRSWEQPVRAVVPAGDLVLAVVGDPSVSSAATYQFQGETVRALSAAAESRARLVALSTRDGRPVWVTGPPGDPDPVLGAPDVCVVSPPLVDGATVYVVLAARRGSVEGWLAALDVPTGRPRWITPIGRAESGLVRTRDEERTLVESRVRSVPRAERPTRSGDEIVVATGAGTVVGVDAGDGRLRWLHALPRYQYEGEAPEDAPIERAHAVSNVPLFGFGAWYVAAPDSPRLVALEGGTGRLRFTGESRVRPNSEVEDGLPEAPECQHLLALGLAPDGRGAVRLAGEERALELRSALTGAFARTSGFPSWRGPERKAPVEPDDARPPRPARGRPWSEGRRVVASFGGALTTTRWPGPLPRGGGAPGEATSSVPWKEEGGASRPVGLEALPPGDVVRAGDVWLVVGAERLVAVAGRRAVEARAAATPRDAVDGALGACLVARRSGGLEELARATRLVAAVDDRESVADAFEGALTAALRRLDAASRTALPAGALEVASRLDALPPSRRGAFLLRICRALASARTVESTAALVRLTEAWRASGAGSMVDVDEAVPGRFRQRGDLHAATRFALLASRSVAERARAEATASDALASAAARGPDALAAAVRAHPGTVAAWVGRVRLVGALFDAGRFADAAAAAGDARLPYEGAGPAVATHLGAAAALRALEADALARAGEVDGARSALFEALAAGPSAARDLAGAPGARLSASLAHEAGWVPADPAPERTLELWPEGGAESDLALAMVRAFEPTGPGAGPGLSVALVARGLSLQAFDLETGASRPIPDTDNGFLGVTLLDRTPGIPGPGILLAGVVAGSAADRAGLREGDWLLAIDGVEVQARADATHRIAACAPGTPLSLTVVRGTERLVRALAVGARGPKDRAPLLAGRAWVASDGWWTVPSRFGLSRVEPRTGERRVVWRARGGGDVRGAFPFAGVCYVWTSIPPLDDAVVTAVDAVSGHELWSTALRGEVSGTLRCVGSAVAVDTKDPDLLWILDRDDGSVRASHARAEREISSSAGAASPVESPPASGASCGLLHLLRTPRGGGGSPLWHAAVNPATGWPAWEREIAIDGQSNRLYPPRLAAGAVVAIAVTDDDIQVTVPRLDGRVPPEPLHADSTRLDTRSWGKLEGDTRLVVEGDWIHVLRTARERRTSVGTIEIDRRALDGDIREDAVLWSGGQGPLFLTTTDREPRRTAWPLVAASRATLEGVWADTLWYDPGGGPVDSCVTWFASGRGNSFLRFPTTSSVVHGQPPVRVGHRMLLPTDEGFVVILLVDPTAR